MNYSRRAVFPAAALAVALCMAAFAAQAADPLEGTWQLNLEKSTFKFTPGPKGQLRTYRITDGLERMTARGVSSEKKPTLVRYEARYDGKEYDMTGSTGGNKISLRRIDPLTTESTQKRDGKPTVVALRRVSEDGKTLTVTSKGTTPSGQVIDALMIFEKH
jgi:hypothetical protein